MGCGSMGTIVSLAHLYKLGNIAKSTGQCIHSRDVSNEQVLNICTLSPSGPKIYKLNLVSAFNKAKFHSLPLSNILNAVSGCTPKYRQNIDFLPHPESCVWMYPKHQKLLQSNQSNIGFPHIQMHP